MVKIAKKGFEGFASGIQLEIINSSSEIIFIELLGISRRINPVTRFCFYVLKHIGIDRRKFYSLSSKPKSESNSENLIKLMSGGETSYAIYGANYINTLSNMVMDSRKLTRKMENDKAIKFFISIKVYDKRIWDTIFEVSHEEKTYTDIKKQLK
ncbi:hypothetical protein [Companilactobacillus sp. HBUAS59699]|uniref:hypothetical protein n=1 Tax=Companilactobacillus sp. HBUAS59699 TaxID=3109358 RepID=UPI002FEE9D50